MRRISIDKVRERKYQVRASGRWCKPAFEAEGTWCHGSLFVCLFVYQFGMAIAVRIDIGKEEPQSKGKSWKALNATEKFVLASEGSEWRAISRFSESGAVIQLVLQLD